MPVTGTALSTALNALKLYTRRVDLAAGQIARAGLTEVPTDGEGASPPSSGENAAAVGAADLGSAMVNMMIAQRAFSAQLRVLRTADEMLKESVEVVK